MVKSRQTVVAAKRSGRWSTVKRLKLWPVAGAPPVAQLRKNIFPRVGLPGPCPRPPKFKCALSEIDLLSGLSINETSTSTHSPTTLSQFPFPQTQVLRFVTGEFDRFKMPAPQSQTKKFGKGERTVPHHTERASKYYPAEDVRSKKVVR
jgi:hypothetical protein